MTIKVRTIGVGNIRASVLPLATQLTVSVSRDDGFAPSEMEILAALKIAACGFESKKKSPKKKANSLVGGSC